MPQRPERPSDSLPESPSGSGSVAVVGAAIVDSLEAPTRLLAARRIEPPALAGRWELPGGKVDPGETWEQALHRELAEELGVDVELGAFVAGPLDDGRWPLSSRHVIAVWLARVVDGEARPLEDHDAVLWLDLADAGGIDWLDGDRPIVEALVRAVAD